MVSRMLVEKYRPNTVAEVLGNERSKFSFIEWLTTNNVKKAALLYGPAGVGKTALVYAAAHDHKYDIVEMNASDARTKKAITKIAAPSTSIHSLDEFFKDLKGSILLLDEVDGIYGREDRGGVSAIVKILQETRTPVVMTANTLDVKKLRPILRYSFLIRFRRVRIPLIVALLSKICQAENIQAEVEALEAIAVKCKGDVRSAINDLQVLSEKQGSIKNEDVHKLNFRNRGLDVYETLKGMFSAGSPEEALKVLNSSLEAHDRLMLSIHDNLPLCYTSLEELAKAYDLLSKADIFYGRIKQENWRLLRYTLELMAFSATLPNTGFNNPDFKYPPTKILLLSLTRKRRGQLSDLCSSIARKCHVSRRSARRNFIPFITMILRRQSEMSSKIASWLELDKKAIIF